MPATIQLPDDLLKATENFAAATHHGVNEIVEQALRDWLARYQTFPTVRLITYG
jgi:predicted transcriptional regulator